MPLGFIAAHGHSGLLGQGPANWPTVETFGTAQARGSQPERVQHAPGAWSPRGARPAHVERRGAHRRIDG
jgi:hypothetical protein